MNLKIQIADSVCYCQYSLAHPILKQQRNFLPKITDASTELRTTNIGHNPSTVNFPSLFSAVKIFNNKQDERTTNRSAHYSLSITLISSYYPIPPDYILQRDCYEKRILKKLFGLPTIFAGKQKWLCQQYWPAYLLQRIPNELRSHP